MPTKKTLPFRLPTDEPKVIESNSGSPEETIIAMKLTETGDMEFYEKGKTNLYEKIQMFKDDCDIDLILMRCTEQNDLSLLNQRNPLYVDFSEFPDNMIEQYSKIKEAEEIFNGLPIEVRNEYGNDFNKFLADFGTDNFLKNLGLLKEEVKTEETTKGEDVNE